MLFKFLVPFVLLTAAQGRLLDLDTMYQEGVNLYDEIYNTTMEWGTYKPNQFLGIKNRNPIPFTVGMIWAAPDPARPGQLTFRHTYKYEAGDGVTAYYEYHDGWSCSRQIINDPQINLRLEIDFLKQVTQDDDTKKIKSAWKVMVNVRPIKEDLAINTIPFIYLSYANKDLEISQISQNTEDGKQHAKVVKVLHKVKGDNSKYEMFEFSHLPEQRLFDVLSLDVQDIPLWNIPQLFERHAKDLVLGSPVNDPNPNLVVLRLSQPDNN